MIELGKKIAYHRKRLDMTQTELGEKLNVTAQAVSKWENGLSDPDLGTLQRLSKIFGVSTDELIREETLEQEQAAVLAEEQAPAAESDAAEGADFLPPPAQSAAPAQPKVIIGYCHSCKKPLEERDPYVLKSGGRGHSDYLLCADCEKKNKISDKRRSLSDEQTSFRRGMIWGPVAGGAVALIFAIAALVTANYALFAGLILALAVFTLVSQLFWGEWLFDFLEFFLHAFRMPGVIFSLDLDGIIWFITVKLTLSVLAWTLSILVFLFGLALTLIVGLFTYPFALPLKLHKIKKRRTEYEEIKQ